MGGGGEGRWEKRHHPGNGHREDRLADLFNVKSLSGRRLRMTLLPGNRHIARGARSFAAALCDVLVVGVQKAGEEEGMVPERSTLGVWIV